MYREWKPKTVMSRLNIYSILALAGIIGPIVLIATDLTAALYDPSYNPIRDSISSLVLTPMGWIQTIGFFTIGLLLEIFVAGLFFSIRGKRWFNPAIGLLFYFGFGLMLIGAFHTDPFGAPHTIGGTIHSVIVTTVFSLFPVVGLLIAPSLKGNSNWKGLYIPTVVISISALALLIVRLFLPAQLSWFGLYERIFVANPIIWLELMAVRLLRLSLSKD